MTTCKFCIYIHPVNSKFTTWHLCQVWLKWSQWFWRKRILKLVNVFSQFCYLGKPICTEQTWIPNHPKMICAKFGWNWRSGSEEEDFFVNVFSQVRNYLLLKKERALHLNPFIQGCFVPSLVEIGPVVLENKLTMWKVYENDDDDNDDGQRTHFDQKSSLESDNWLTPYKGIF